MCTTTELASARSFVMFTYSLLSYNRVIFQQQELLIDRHRFLLALYGLPSFPLPLEFLKPFSFRKSDLERGPTYAF